MEQRNLGEGDVRWVQAVGCKLLGEEEAASDVQFLSFVFGMCILYKNSSNNDIWIPGEVVCTAKLDNFTSIQQRRRNRF